MKRLWLLLLVLALFAVACTNEPDPTPTSRSSNRDDDDDDDDDDEPTQEPEPTDTPEPTEAAVDDPPPSPEPTGDPDPDITAVWPPPGKAYASLSRQPVTEAEQATHDRLINELPPERSDIDLAIAYRGVTDFAFEPPPLVADPLPVGTRQTFVVNNFDSNTNTSPEFVLLAVSDHAYFWFDTTEGLTFPEEDLLQEMEASFDAVYEQDVAFFGSEDTPGVDGDPRVHIVNAAPATICDSPSFCGLLGYVASSNTLPQEVDPQSNEKEMFVMNGSIFGSDTYIEVLAHEFRHMIEENHDVNDIDWEVEGSAMLAEDLLGFPSDPIFRGNLFLSNPDQQLNRWTDGDTSPYYGQGYVLNRYIFNRLGEALYKVFATHPAPGLAAIDAIAAEQGVDFDGLTLWLDWLVALAIHNEANVAPKYQLREGLNTADMRIVSTLPATFDTTVRQYAADYYRLAGDGPVTIDFTGSNHAQLMNVIPASGTHMWLANRGNWSNVRLMREFDLTAVDTATLEYAVYRDIEEGYDFAYVSVSTDGGQTWQGLIGEQMQGLSAGDDPSNSAYLDRFYTGQGRDWEQETADLTPYAGQVIQVRFEYVTDPILTFGGLAIDNISIPEIDFYDDAETDNGWIAEGFVRATGYVPQQWHLQLITFDGGAPVVQHIELSEDNTVSLDLSLDGAEDEPILIVAASAPMTLEPAYYLLEIQ